MAMAHRCYRSLDGNGPSMAKALQWKTRFDSQRPIDGKRRSLRKQGVNCTTVTSKHPLFSQSLDSWYGLVGGCCITRKSRSEDVAAIKAMEQFEALPVYVECWLERKKTPRRQRQGRFYA